ncbi:beta-N-acetylglucosaminidase domain-containing protein [Deinococcus peraridilitoris]|uniref:Beta-N-acetylglucosaminidase n=1 Tax=Deinococcus peraridilitoris (strain DSM 19664 / LMG 22246 / CIP 109416 / KR-200) TaxID=937777 RepID=K9ZY30_DEIPD|nr:beta-N-acetylglucosaminidase domain-containing protein [Deinococcus peraridilitoris]AFZ65635.1 beta-N-acetylglucosaminidase [Deinococcus peraridilitoris DSM 19664]
MSHARPAPQQGQDGSTANSGLRQSLELLGVIEGFYGRPWHDSQRHALFQRMARWGMNTFMYAPKDDLWHRARWRAPYPPENSAVLAKLAQNAQDAGVQFVYALAPGLDLQWDDPHDRQALLAKLTGVSQLGVRHFALLFDDIPYAADRAAQAELQADAANVALRHLRQQGTTGVFLFCPTEYCARRAAPDVARSRYLRRLGEQLDPEIELLWTGPEVVSVDISPASIREVAEVLRRRPVLWDNLHANDYAPRRAHLGPYSGRPMELRAELRGILSNPNNQYELNYVPLMSLAEYAHAHGDWSAEASLQRALNAWHAEYFQFPGAQVTIEDLAWLADVLYLPQGPGERALRLLRDLRAILDAAPGSQDAPLPHETLLHETQQRFRRVLHALETGTHRELLYDLHPFLTDLLEELGRLRRRIEGRTDTEPNGVHFAGALAEQLTRLG